MLKYIGLKVVQVIFTDALPKTPPSFFNSCFMTCNVQNLILLIKIIGGGSAESHGSLQAACRRHGCFCLPCRRVVYKSVHLPESVFASSLILGGDSSLILECEQFRAGTPHHCTKRSQVASPAFCSLCHSSNNGPAAMTCNTCTSFASCSDTDVSLFLAQRRDRTFVATQLQYGNY